MDNTLFDRYGRHDLSTEVPTFNSPRCPEFPPLSQQPVGEGCSMPANNPVDQLVLEKCTPALPGEEEKDSNKEERDCSHIVPQTKEMTSYGIKQVKHSMAMILELKLLLTHEVALLQQVLTRIDKFKHLVDANKKKITQWEANYKEKIPDYDNNLTKLVGVPQSQVLKVEGWPLPVQQKILLQIVSRTLNTANRVGVQLSMEETVANDIDLTLADVRKHCILMLRQVHSWLNNLKTQECVQKVILERWNNCDMVRKEICSKDLAAGESSTSINLKVYEDRLKKLEYAICCLAGPAYGTCKKGPPSPPCPPTDATWSGADKPGPYKPDGPDKVVPPSTREHPPPPICEPSPKPTWEPPPTPIWEPQAQPFCQPPPPEPEVICQPSEETVSEFDDNDGSTDSDEERWYESRYPSSTRGSPPQAGRCPTDNWQRQPQAIQEGVTAHPILPCHPSILMPVCTPPQRPPPPPSRAVQRPPHSPAPSRACPPPTRPQFNQSVPPPTRCENQGGLQGEADGNRVLQDLVSTFRDIKETLTVEMEKAVQLSNKLQGNKQCTPEVRR